MWQGRIGFRIANSAGEKARQKNQKRIGRERCRQCDRQNHSKDDGRWFLEEWWDESEQAQDIGRTPSTTWLFYCPEHRAPPSAGLTTWTDIFPPQESAQDQPVGRHERKDEAEDGDALPVDDS